MPRVSTHGSSSSLSLLLLLLLLLLPSPIPSTTLDVLTRNLEYLLKLSGGRANACDSGWDDDDDDVDVVDDICNGQVVLGHSCVLR